MGELCGRAVVRGTFSSSPKLTVGGPDMWASRGGIRGWRAIGRLRVEVGGGGGVTEAVVGVDGGRWEWMVEDGSGWSKTMSTLTMSTDYVD